MTFKNAVTIKKSALLAAIAGALLLAGSSAAATGLTSKVSVGAATGTGTHPITATSTGGVLDFYLEQPNGAFFRLQCQSGNVPASPASVVRSGSGITDIADLNKVNIKSCGWPGGNLPAASSGTWKLHRSDGTPTAGTTDVVPGHIDGIALRFENSVCKFSITGTARTEFRENGQQLAVNEQATATPGLVMSNITGCGGQLKPYGKAKFIATFTVNSPDGTINIRP